MKKDKISDIIKYIFHNDIPDNIQSTFKKWLISPHDKEAKDEVLNNIWEILPSESNKDECKKGLQKLHNEINPKSNIIKLWRTYKKIASVIVISLSIFGSGYITSKIINKDNQKYYLVTADKSKGEFILPDSTKVWLNSNSRLTYDNNFSKESRSVKLEGEGFFEVTKDKQKPFNVEMDNVSIEVLGTKFNARNYKHEDIEEVVLAKGSVKISGNMFASVILNPNERFTLNKKRYHKKIELVSSHNYSTWFDKHLNFEESTLEDIFTQLEKWYNVKIDVSSNVNLYSRMSLKIFHEPIDDILRVISTINNLEYTTLISNNNNELKYIITN